MKTIQLVLVSMLGAGCVDSAAGEVAHAAVFPGQAALCSKLGAAADCDPCDPLGFYGDAVCDEELVATGFCLRPDPACSSNGRIDFCGNDIDEDGDGQDRPCGPLPPRPRVARELAIVDRPLREGIRLTGDAVALEDSDGAFVNPRFSLALPRGVLVDVRVVNDSSFDVAYTAGDAGAGVLAMAGGPGVSSATLTLRGDTNLRFEAPTFQPVDSILVFASLEPEVPSDVTARSGYLLGTATVDGAPVDLLLDFHPRSGAECPSTMNQAESTQDCAGLAECHLGNVLLHVRLRDRATGGTIYERRFHQQCNGDGRRARLSWSRSGGVVLSAEDFDLSSPGTSDLHLHGTPDDLRGTLKLIDGSFVLFEHEIEAHFVAPPEHP
jgi:hypothetical protein